DIKNDSKLNSKELAECFKKGAERAKDSIQNPQKGTILDVMSAFALEFKKEAETKKDILKNFEKGIKKAHKALLNTTEEMPLLKQAGVVDAGGLGFLMILETYFDVLIENDNPFSKKVIKKSVKTKRLVQILTNRYEVVSLMREVSLSEGEMYEKLKDLGDCLDIISVKNRAKIHIHTDDPYIVRDVIRTFGEEETMRIEDMAREVLGEESLVKNKIGIVVDESTSLNEKNIQHYKIESIPYKIEWDGIDKLPGENIAEKLKIAKDNGFKYSPSVCPINAKFFKEAFEKQLQTFEEVICITSSNEYFNTFKIAEEGKKMLLKKQEKVHLLDSQNIGAGEAIMILKAIDLINEQKKANVIIEELKGLAIRNIGVINSPFDNSKNSNKIKKVIGKNKFLLVTADKEIRLRETLKKDECVDKIINRVKKDLKNNQKTIAVIVHNGNLNKAKELKERLKPLNVAVSFINSADPALSLKIGYKGLMLSYIKL
ncbi:MAG: DegV family protein, partial [Candidatus Pacebacteria bacterium]|nr:DegV family protein [Candidatus Paceibacterota bacterium]